MNTETGEKAQWWCIMCMFEAANAAFVYPTTHWRCCVVCRRILPIRHIWQPLHFVGEIVTNLLSELTAPEIKWDTINCRNTKGWPLLVIPLLSVVEYSINYINWIDRFTLAIQWTESLLRIRESSKSCVTASIEDECNVNSLYPSIWHILFLVLPHTVPVAPQWFEFMKLLNIFTPIVQKMYTQPAYPRVSILEILLARNFVQDIAYWVCSCGIDPRCKDWLEEEKETLDCCALNDETENCNTDGCLIVCPKIGEEISVQDTNNTWNFATIIHQPLLNKSQTRVLVSYTGWNVIWNEWMDFPNTRIAGRSKRLSLNIRQTETPDKRSFVKFDDHPFKNTSFLRYASLLDERTAVGRRMCEGWDAYKLWKYGVLVFLNDHLLDDLAKIAICYV